MSQSPSSSPTSKKLPSKEEFRNQCSILYNSLQKLLKLEDVSITKVGQDIHLIGKLKDGKYLHIRTWIQHMFDCNEHKQLVRDGQIFIGGYIREQRKPTLRTSPEDGEEALNFGTPFFTYGWFENNSEKIFEMICNAQPSYFSKKVETTVGETKERVRKKL